MGTLGTGLLVQPFSPWTYLIQKQLLHLEIPPTKMGMVVQDCNSSTQEAEARGF
jgi:hypothetical protein